jgi:hypothetical protein
VPAAGAGKKKKRPVLPSDSEEEFDLDEPTKAAKAKPSKSTKSPAAKKNKKGRAPALSAGAQLCSTHIFTEPGSMAAVAESFTDEEDEENDAADSGSEDDYDEGSDDLVDSDDDNEEFDDRCDAARAVCATSDVAA